MPCKPELQILDTADALFEAAAAEFAALVKEAVKSQGRFAVALAGGSTPKRLYALLAAQYGKSLPWQNVYFFFGDERHVPPDDPDSNYRMANEALLSKIPLPPENVFRIKAEKDAEAAAEEYEQTLRRFFTLKENDIPSLDLVLLGIGPDGHTASLFPGTAALNENRRLVVANQVPKMKTLRITVTYPVLNHARVVMFLVSGADKTRIVREVLKNTKANLPSQRVCPESGKLLWMIDRDAGASLQAS